MESSSPKTDAIDQFQKLLDKDEFDFVEYRRLAASYELPMSLRPEIWKILFGVTSVKRSDRGPQDSKACENYKKCLEKFNKMLETQIDENLAYLQREFPRTHHSDPVFQSPQVHVVIGKVLRCYLYCENQNYHGGMTQIVFLIAFGYLAPLLKATEYSFKSEHVERFNSLDEQTLFNFEVNLYFSISSFFAMHNFQKMSKSLEAINEQFLKCIKEKNVPAYTIFKTKGINTATLFWRLIMACFSFDMPTELTLKIFDYLVGDLTNHLEIIFEIIAVMTKIFLKEFEILDETEFLMFFYSQPYENWDVEKIIEILKYINTNWKKKK